MQRSHFTLHGALFGAVMLALLGAGACAIDEAAPADEGEKVGRASPCEVASDAATRDAAPGEFNKRVIIDSQKARDRPTTAKDVREYAELMIKAHEDVLDRTEQLLKACPNTTSAMGSAYSIQEISAFLPAPDPLTMSLDYASDEKFDRVYIDGQIERHAKKIAQLSYRAISSQCLPQKQVLEAGDDCSGKWREEDERELAEWRCHLAAAQRIRPTL